MWGGEVGCGRGVRWLGRVGRNFQKFGFPQEAQKDEEEVGQAGGAIREWCAVWEGREHEGKTKTEREKEAREGEGRGGERGDRYTGGGGGASETDHRAYTDRAR